MSAEIIKLTFPQRANSVDQQTSATVHQIPEKPELSRRGRPLAPATTDSCRNQRARLRRRDVWRHAARVTDYWRARIDWHNALATAQRHGIGDSGEYEQITLDYERRCGLVDRWRAALVEQMLTPAPDLAAVAWKRANLRAENYRYTDVKPERLQRSIDTDVEWLAAHPTRKSQNAMKKQAASAVLEEKPVTARHGGEVT
jgi:hypothetical protein